MPKLKTLNVALQTAKQSSTCERKLWSTKSIGLAVWKSLT